MTAQQRVTSLPPALARLMATVVAFAMFMVGNAIFLVLIRLTGILGIELLTGPATALPRFFQSMVLAHTGVGLVLVTLGIVFFIGLRELGCHRAARQGTEPGCARCDSHLVRGKHGATPYGANRLVVSFPVRLQNDDLRLGQEPVG